MNYCTGSWNPRKCVFCYETRLFDMIKSSNSFLDSQKNKGFLSSNLYWCLNYYAAPVDLFLYKWWNFYADYNKLIFKEIFCTSISIVYEIILRHLITKILMQVKCELLTPWTMYNDFLLFLVGTEYSKTKNPSSMFNTTF